MLRDLLSLRFLRWRWVSGANTAVFTLTHALLLSSLPVPDPGELVRLTIDLSAAQNDNHDAPLSLPMIEGIQRQSRTMQDAFGWCVYDFPFRDGNVNGGIHGAILSGNAFEALREYAPLPDAC